MADIILPAQLPAAPARPMPAARTEAVRAAQRAFFETALAGEAQAASRPATATAPTSAATAAPRELRPSADAFDGPAPARPLRPGSLLDIRV